MNSNKIQTPSEDQSRLTSLLQPSKPATESSHLASKQPPYNTFNIAVLASGSSGNVTYIETDQRKILVDAGLSGSKIEQLLRSIGRDMAEIDSIFVTHEHSDHIKGLGVLARRYELAIYANHKTWLAIGDKCGKIPKEKKFELERGEMRTFGDIDILSFGVSHDAAEPQFYAFQKDGKRFVILTDLGYVSDQQRQLFKNCDAYIMEHNHDLDMLRLGRYPWKLKQRILGDSGHLSNEAAASAMCEMIGDKTKQIYLGHLSKENNMPQIAHQTFTSMLTSAGWQVGQQFEVVAARPDRAMPLLSL